ncbi:MAG: hypothetical protein RLZ12_19 [Bacillota bacterium]|jgi:uncharacterized protein (UPF0297 family)
MIDETVKFTRQQDFRHEFRDTLRHIYDVLEKKGYNPVNQIVGYLISGDPAYIPRHDNARSLIRKIERDELIEAMVKVYLSEDRTSNK